MEAGMLHPANRRRPARVAPSSGYARGYSDSMAAVARVRCWKVIALVETLVHFRPWKTDGLAGCCIRCRVSAPDCRRRYCSADSWLPFGALPLIPLLGVGPAISFVP